MTSCQEHMWRMGDDDEDDARLSHHGEEGVWWGGGKIRVAQWISCLISSLYTGKSLFTYLYKQGMQNKEEFDGVG